MSENESALRSEATDPQGSNLTNYFNIHRKLREVKSGDVWTAIYDNPLLTAGYRGIFPTSELTEDLFCHDPNAFFLRCFENLSIDSITLLLNAPAIGKESTQRWWAYLQSTLEGYSFYGESNRYNNTLRWNGFTVEYGVKSFNKSNLETVRIEFNPNKANLAHLACLFSAFHAHSLKTARVSRLDVAIDYAIYLNPFCWFYNREIDISRYGRGGDQLQTTYFGSQHSDLKIRIYNKKLEQLKSGNDLGIENFWRVEAEIKKFKGESSFFLLDKKHLSGFNPFDNLCFHDPYGFDEGKGGFALFVAVCRWYGMSYALSKVGDHKTRLKYRSMLEERMVKLDFNLPNVIYENIFDGVYSRFVDEIQRLFDLGQEQRKELRLKGSLLD